MINYCKNVSYRALETRRMVRVAIIRGERFVENNKWFSSLDAVEKYVKYICPKKYGFGKYNYIIFK